MSQADRAGEFFQSQALPELRTWSERPTRGDLMRLTGRPAVYLLLDERGGAVQLATTQALRRQLVARLAGPVDQTARRADLAAVVRGVRWRELACAFEGHWWYYRLARELYPRDYRRMISFGPAWFLHVDLEAPIPNISISERVWCLAGEFVGPWATRKACQEALTGLRDLFDLCRYPEQIRRLPHGTRCAYAEMGRCDAPCDGSAPLQDYVARCRAAWQFAGGGPGKWVEATTARMQQAAAEQKYELAHDIREQLRLAQRWQAEWARQVRPVQRLSCLVALPATRRKAWKLLLFERGNLVEGPVASERCLGAVAVDWLREQARAAPAELDATTRMEQTWLLCRFLLGRERATGVVVPLAWPEVPPDLEHALVAQVAGVKRRCRAGRGKSEADSAMGQEPNASVG